MDENHLAEALAYSDCRDCVEKPLNMECCLKQYFQEGTCFHSPSYRNVGSGDTTSFTTFVASSRHPPYKLLWSAWHFNIAVILRRQKEKERKHSFLFYLQLFCFWKLQCTSCQWPRYSCWHDFLDLVRVAMLPEQWTVGDHNFFFFFTLLTNGRLMLVLLLYAAVLQAT